MTFEQGTQIIDLLTLISDNLAITGSVVCVIFGALTFMVIQSAFKI